MLADIAQKIQVAHILEPVVIVDNLDVLATKDLMILGYNRLLVLGDFLGGFKFALSVFAVGVADHAGSAAHQQYRLVAVFHKPFDHHGRRQVADSHRVGAGVDSPVESDRLAIENTKVFVGGLVEQAAPGQFFGECHMALSITQATPPKNIGFLRRLFAILRSRFLMRRQTISHEQSQRP